MPRSSGFNRAQWLLASAGCTVALVALVCRVAIALPGFGDLLRFYVRPDSFEYDQLAINLLAGHGYSQGVVPPYLPDVRRTPLFPLLLASTYALVGYLPSVAVATNMALGTLACVLTAVLGARGLNRGTRLLA